MTRVRTRDYKVYGMKNWGLSKDIFFVILLVLWCLHWYCSGYNYSILSRILHSPIICQCTFFTHYIALALANSVKGNCLYVPSSINWVIKFLPARFKSVKILDNKLHQKLKIYINILKTSCFPNPLFLIICIYFRYLP